jgi:sarcosine oxidase/L-pipecolate oxidase
MPWPTPLPPSTYLIIGAGEFGLSTGLSLLRRHPTAHITILDSSPTLPNPTGSSVDASRIVRADYAHASYARLALEAQHLWRDTSPSGWGGEGRYHEPGFLLTADKGMEGYLRCSLGNVKGLIGGEKVEELYGREEICRASGYAGASGDWGYCNWSSGWADAEAVVGFVLKKVKQEGEGRVVIRPGVRVERLLFDGEGRCEGVRTGEGEEVRAEQTILAAGAWSGCLVDLRGRAMATGQPLAYIGISEEEQERMGKRPTIMNMSRGMFVIPPRKRELKVARHGFGYQNLKTLPATWKSKGSCMNNGTGAKGDEDMVEISVPEVKTSIPKEAELACREALREVIPEMAEREFARTRICWYCDTADGNFIITHHPKHKNLFVATGGSGHGFKFFPVIGEKIVDILEGKQTEYAELWRWRDPVMDFAYCDDGSRSGPKGMLLHEELARS